MQQLTDYIKVFDDVCPKNVCRDIIAEFERNISYVEKHDTSGYKFDQLNLNSAGLIQLSTAFVNACIPKIKEYLHDLTLREYLPISGFEEVRIKKYYKNSDYRFDTHVDVTNKATSVRSLVFILYLNDNDGVTDFPTLNYSYTPKRGSLIMFPPTWMYPHAGRVPTNRDKYIMMSSLHYS